MIRSTFLSSVFILLGVSAGAQTVDNADSGEDVVAKAPEEATPEPPVRLDTSAPITTLIPVDSVTAWGLVEQDGTFDIFRCNGDAGTCSWIDWVEVDKEAR